MGQQSASTSILQLSAKVSASLPQPSQEHPEASEKAPAEAKEANRAIEQQEYRPQQNLLLRQSALPLPYQRLGNNTSRSISHLQRSHQEEEMYRLQARDEERRGAWDLEGERLAVTAHNRRIAYLATRCNRRAEKVAEGHESPTASSGSAAAAQKAAAPSAPEGDEQAAAAEENGNKSRADYAAWKDHDWGGWSTESEKHAAEQEVTKSDEWEQPRHKKRPARRSNQVPFEMASDGWGDRFTTPAGALLHLENRRIQEIPAPVMLTEDPIGSERDYAGWEPRNPGGLPRDQARDLVPREMTVRLVPRMQGRLEQWCQEAVANLPALNADDGGNSLALAPPKQLPARGASTNRFPATAAFRDETTRESQAVMSSASGLGPKFAKFAKFAEPLQTLRRELPVGRELDGFPGARAADNLAPPALQIQPLAPSDLPAALSRRPASQHNDTVHLDDSQPDWSSPAYSDAWQRADGQRADRDELRFIPRQVQVKRGAQGSRFGFMRSAGSRKVPHRQEIPVAVRQSPERRTSPSPAAARCEARQASRRLEAFMGRRGLERARSLREEAPSSAGVDDEMKRPHMRPPKRPNERDVAHWGGKDTWGNDRFRMIGAPKEVVRRQESDRKIGWGRVAHPQPLVRQEQIEQARWSQPVREMRQARTAFNIQILHDDSGLERQQRYAHPGSNTGSTCSKWNKVNPNNNTLMPIHIYVLSSAAGGATQKPSGVAAALAGRFPASSAAAGVSRDNDSWGAVSERPNSLWQELPAPLVHEVAKKLEHNGDVAAMRTTCRSWHGEASAAIRQLALFKRGKSFTDQKLKKLLAAFENVERLDLFTCEQLTGDGLLALESLGKLERLRVRGCSKLSHSTLSWLPHLRGLKRLQELWVGIQDRWGLRALSGLTQLVNLNLQQTTQMDMQHLKELSSLVNLRSLCLQGCSAVRDAGLSGMLAGTSCLEELDLRSCTQLTPSCLEALRLLPNLQVLDTAHFRRMTEAGLSNLLFATALTCLNLGFSAAVNDESVQRLALMSQLQVLSLNGCINLGDDGIEALLPLVNLRVLNLTRCCHMTDVGARHLLSFPALVAVSLNDCPHVSREALGELAWNLQVLFSDHTVQTLEAPPTGVPGLDLTPLRRAIGMSAAPKNRDEWA